MTHWVGHRRSQEETFRKWTHPPPPACCFREHISHTSPSTWTGGRREGSGAKGTGVIGRLNGDIKDPGESGGRVDKYSRVDGPANSHHQGYMRGPWDEGSSGQSVGALGVVGETTKGAGVMGGVANALPTSPQH